MRRHVSGHADRYAGRTVDEKIRERGGHDPRFFKRAVVVDPEIHGLFFYVREKLSADPRHPDFGVTHGRRRIAVNRTEVALSVHERVTERKVLHHPRYGVVHGRVAVWVVFAYDVSDHARGFFIRLVPLDTHLVHGEDYAPVHGFESVADVRQSPSYDYAHGVIEVGFLHLVFYRDGYLLVSHLLDHASNCRECVSIGI